MPRKILFVSFVVDADSESPLIHAINHATEDMSGVEVFNLGQAPYVSPAEMFARFGSVRKVAAREFKPGQASFDFVPPSAAR